MNCCSSVPFPDKPHQAKDLLFPKRTVGQSVIVSRSFQSTWFDKWPWLHYNEGNYTVFCHICTKVNVERKLRWATKVDASFVTSGFSKWKLATTKFDKHQCSQCHSEAVLKTVTLHAVTKDFGETLSREHEQEKIENRKCLLKAMSSVKFLARQGLPLRGHDNESNSNFMQLLQLRGENDATLASWLMKKSDNYTSPLLQNEILKTMALNVLRQVSNSFHLAPFVTLMVDETTDVSTNSKS